MSILPPFLVGLGPGVAPQRLLDQDFGLSPADVISIIMPPVGNKDFIRPWRHMAGAARDAGSTIVSNKDKFQVNLDVQHFAPDEISVKTSDGYIIIEGKHEEKQDEHGFVSRQFTRRYILPEICDPNTVECKLSSDGVLSVIAPKTTPFAKNERSIPICQTGPIRKEIKDPASKPAQADANGTAK